MKKRKYFKFIHENMWKTEFGPMNERIMENFNENYYY